jgi:hypothetical protein
MLTTTLNTFDVVVVTLAFSGIANLTTPIAGRALDAGRVNFLLMARAAAECPGVRAFPNDRT